MKNLSNPWSELPGFNCFGCAEHNIPGLKMKFTEEGELITSRWDPKPEYQGFHNILHGGIQATLMDEIASWTVFVKAEKAAVTFNLELKFKKPVLISNGPLRLTSRIVKSNSRTVRVNVLLFDADGQECSEAIADFYVVTDGELLSNLRFPGKDAFFKEQ